MNQINHSINKTHTHILYYYIIINKPEDKEEARADIEIGVFEDEKVVSEFRNLNPFSGELSDEESVEFVCV